jgi:hypothetical protein
MEMRHEATQDMEQAELTRLALLEQRMTAAERSGEHREARLCKLEDKITDLASKFDLLRAMVDQRLAEARVASWQQFWILAGLVLGSAVGMTVWMSQQVLSHALK